MVQAFFPGRLNDRAAAIDGKYTFALVGLLIICPPPPPPKEDTCICATIFFVNNDIYR